MGASTFCMPQWICSAVWMPCMGAQVSSLEHTWYAGQSPSFVHGFMQAPSSHTRPAAQVFGPSGSHSQLELPSVHWPSTQVSPLTQSLSEEQPHAEGKPFVSG